MKYLPSSLPRDGRSVRFLLTRDLVSIFCLSPHLLFRLFIWLLEHRHTVTIATDYTSIWSIQLQWVFEYLRIHYIAMNTRGRQVGGWVIFNRLVCSETSLTFAPAWRTRHLMAIMGSPFPLVETFFLLKNL